MQLIKKYIDKDLKELIEAALFILIAGFTFARYEYVTDFVAGRLDHLWILADTVEGGASMRFITIFLVIGIGAGYIMQKLIDSIKRKPKELTQLALQEKQRISKYATVGGMGFIWKLVILYILVDLIEMSEYIAVIPVFFVISLHNYLLNSFWTFKGWNSGKAGYFKYVLLNGATALIYFAVYYMFISIGTHYLMASTLGGGSAALLNFALARFKIWKLA